MTKRNSTLLIILCFFAIYVIWGSTYMMNKVAVSEIPPLLLAAIRFSLAGIIVFVIAKGMKISLLITRKQCINSAIAGFLFLVFGNGVFVWALKYVDSGFAALVASTQPLFVLLLVRLIDRKRMETKSIIGICLGILGMYLLVSQKEISNKEGNFPGNFYDIDLCLSWSYGSVFVSKADLPKNFFISTGYQMLISGILLFVCSFLFDENWISPVQWSFKAQLSMLLLILFGSIAAFTSFNYLLKVVSLEKVTTSAYVNPVVALFLGWFFLDEVLTTQSIIASVILLTGVYFIISKKKLPLKNQRL